jgi:hypothetical protein
MTVQEAGIAAPLYPAYSGKWKHKRSLWERQITRRSQAKRRYCGATVCDSVVCVVLVVPAGAIGAGELLVLSSVVVVVVEEGIGALSS